MLQKGHAAGLMRQATVKDFGELRRLHLRPKRQGTTPKPPGTYYIGY